MARLVMLIDMQRCVGCNGCVIACKSENNLPGQVFWNKVVTGNPAKPNEIFFTDTPKGEFISKSGIVNDISNKVVALEQNYYTKACQHCAKPLCVDVCPTKASFVDKNGVVDVDYDLCIGCDSCIEACPYDVRHHNKENEKYYLPFATGSKSKGMSPHRPVTVDKCNFCNHRLDEGKKPFCVENCSSAARFFGDIEDSKSEVSAMLKKRKHTLLMPEKGTKPSIYFLI